MPERVAPRHLITIGVSKCRSGAPALPGVETDLSLLVSTLTSPSFGYVHTLQGLSRNPSSANVLRKLSAFFCSVERTDDEVVIVYCAGHGCLLGRWFYLACSDTTGDLVGTAFPLDAVVRMVAGSRIRFVLLILDTCFAAQGATEVMAGLDEIDRARSLSNHAHLHVIAAARSREAAKDGLFTPLLCKEIRRADRDDAGQFLALGDIAEHVNRALEAKKHPQRAKQFGAGSAPFFTNPAWMARLTRRESDLANFWEPRARGGGPTGAIGWVFTGREKENKKILKWLERRDAKGLLVVTGPPGSGKSAILSRLVLLSDPKGRAGVPVADMPDGTVPPPGCVTLAILAHGKSVADIAREIADRLCPGLAQPEDIDKLLGALSQTQRRSVVILDGPDQSQQPQVIARTLLSRLAEVPNLLIVIAVRAEFLVGLTGVSSKIDLSIAKASRHDIAKYVERLLTGSTEDRGLHSDPRLFQRAAARVARHADGHYLIAQLTAAALVESGIADERRWDSFPETLDAAFDAYFEALQEDRTFVEDMLRPLAFAEGDGLPESLWPSLASEVASAVRGAPPQGYGPSDVVRLLRRAASFVQTRDEHGGERSFRLFHGALEHYFRKSFAREVQGVFVDALLGPFSSGMDYAVDFLPLHARGAGCLDKLVRDDSRILVEAAPRKLVDALMAARTPEGQSLAGIYEQACHLLVGERPDVRAAHLELFALLNGERELSKRIGALEYHRPFRPAWAHWMAAHPNRTLARHAGKVEAAAACIVEDALVHVSAGADGIVRLGGHGQTVELSGHGAPVNAACICTSEMLDEAVFVTAGQDGQIRRWGMRCQDEIGTPIQAEGQLVAVVGLTLLEQPAVLAADMDGRIRAWNLKDGGRIAGIEFRTDDPVQSMAVLPTDCGELLLCGNQSGFLEAFNLTSMEPHGHKVPAHDAAVTDIALLQGAPDPCFVSCGDDGKLAFWRLTGSVFTSVGERRHEHALYALSSDWRTGGRSSKCVFAAAGADGLLYLYEWPELAQVVEPRRGHGDWVSGVSLLRMPSGLKAVSAGGDGTVRLWNILDAPDRVPRVSHRSEAVHSIVLCELPETAMVVTGGPAGDLNTFDLDTGEGRGTTRGLGRVHAVTALALGEANYVVAAGEGPVWLHRVHDSGKIGDAEPLDAGSFIGPAYAVAARADAEANLHVAAAGMNGRIFWWASRTSHPRLVSERPGDPVTTLAYSPWQMMLASGRGSGRLSLIGAQGSEAHAELGEPIHSLTFMELRGTPSLAAGCGDGTIRLFDATFLRPLGRLDVPGSRRIMALGSQRGSPMGQVAILAGCDDGSLSMVEWPSGFRRLKIETGAPMTGLVTHAQRAVVASLSGLVVVDLT